MGNYSNLSDWAKACSDAINQIKGTTYKMAPRHFPKIIDEIELEGLPSGLDSTTAPPQLLPLMSDIANSIRRKCSCDDCRVNRKRIKPNDFPTHILKINNTSECRHNFDFSPYDYYLNSDATCNYCGALHDGVWCETGDGYTGSDPMCFYVEEYCADHPGHERNRIDIPCNVGSDGICTSCGRTHSVCSGGYDCIHDWQGNNVMDENGNWTGEIEYICSNCGAGGTFNESENPPSTGESSGGCHFTLVETYPATCVRQGVEIYQCSDCQATRIQMLSPIDHNLVFIEAIDSTCTESGYTKYKCNHCNNIFEEDIEATGHDMQDIPAQEATCQQIGWKAYKKCKNCDYTEGYEEIPKLEHDFIEGYQCKEGYCGWCEITCPHTNWWNDNDVDPGYCLDCGYIPHVLVDISPTDPTCTESGNTRGVECAECDYKTWESINALGHDYSKLISSGYAATCTSTGRTAKYQCSRCESTTGGSSIPKKAHTPGSAATCTKAQTCTVCGTTLAEATGHVSGSWVTEIPATCGTSGEKVLYCAKCGNSLDYQSIPATGDHRWVSNSDGTHTCSSCGSSGGCTLHNNECVRCGWSP